MDRRDIFVRIRVVELGRAFSTLGRGVIYYGGVYRRGRFVFGYFGGSGRVVFGVSLLSASGCFLFFLESKCGRVFESVGGRGFGLRRFGVFV